MRHCGTAGVVLSCAGAVYLWLPQAQDRAAALWWFFVSYSLFFTFLGCAGVAQGALLGKIIPAGRRGSALSAAHTISGPVNLLAILAVYSLVRSGAFPTPRNYAFSFTVTTFLFALSGLAIAQAREKPSDAREGGAGLRARLVYARKMVTTNRDDRILLLIQILLGFGGGALSFYTAYGKRVSASTTPTCSWPPSCRCFSSRAPPPSSGEWLTAGATRGHPRLVW